MLNEKTEKKLSRIRLLKERRYENILRVAINLSIEIGYANIRAGSVAERAQVSRPLVLHYFGSLRNLKKSVMERAIKERIIIIVMQGVSSNDPIALRAPAELIREASKTIY